MAFDYYLWQGFLHNYRNAKQLHFLLLFLTTVGLLKTKIGKTKLNTCYDCYMLIILVISQPFKI